MPITAVLVDSLVLNQIVKERFAHGDNGLCATMYRCYGSAVYFQKNRRIDNFSRNRCKSLLHNNLGVAVAAIRNAS